MNKKVVSVIGTIIAIVILTLSAILGRPPKEGNVTVITVVELAQGLRAAFGSGPGTAIMRDVAGTNYLFVWPMNASTYGFMGVSSTGQFSKSFMEGMQAQTTSVASIMVELERKGWTYITAAQLPTVLQTMAASYLTFLASSAEVFVPIAIPIQFGPWMPVEVRS